MSDRELEVLRQQVALMLRNFPITILSSYLVAVLATWAMQGLVEKTALNIWLVSQTIISGSLFFWFRLRLRHNNPRQVARWMVMCLGVMGMSWGSFAVTAVFYGPPVGMLYAMSVMCGVMSGWFGLSGPIFRALWQF